MIAIVEETKTRHDLAARRETKYPLDRSDVSVLRRILEVNARRQVHNHAVSKVRSVYFDDAKLSACRANLDGLGRRRKLRVRWYDQPTPGRIAFAEIKWRDNQVTGKHRFRIESDRPLAEVHYSEWVQMLHRMLPGEFTVDLLACPEPTVIVEYSREHFISADGRLRITIDYDLAFYDQTRRCLVSTSFPVRRPGLVIVEGKTESELRQLLYPLSIRAGRCSKYVCGCQALGLMSWRV